MIMIGNCNELDLVETTKNLNKMSSERRETRPLSFWIGRALRRAAREGCASSSAYGTGDHGWRTNKALCSYDEYLMPALRAAYSLVDQICKEEAIGKAPTLSVDWVENIVVHSNNRVEPSEVMHGDVRRDSLRSLDDSQGFIDSLGFDFKTLTVNKTLTII